MIKEIISEMVKAAHFHRNEPQKQQMAAQSS